MLQEAVGAQGLGCYLALAKTARTEMKGMSSWDWTEMVSNPERTGLATERNPMMGYRRVPH